MVVIIHLPSMMKSGMLGRIRVLRIYHERRENDKRRSKYALQVQAETNSLRVKKAVQDMLKEKWNRKSRRGKAELVTVHCGKLHLLNKEQFSGSSPGSSSTVKGPRPDQSQVI